MVGVSYSCMYCNYQGYTQHILKHYLAHHKEQFYKSNKEAVRIASRGKDLVPFFVNLKGERIRVKGCLGCNKFYSSEVRVEKHKVFCTKKQEHQDVAKSLIPTLTSPLASPSLVAKQSLHLLPQGDALETPYCDECAPLVE
jgi:hypothetical protein